MAALGGEAALPIPAVEDAQPCELLSLIGETPRAATFLAEQTWPLRRLVAFKLFKNDLLCPWVPTSEEKTLPRHPNIGHVIERGWIAGRPYVMTEYFAGGPITRCYDRHHLTLGPRMEALIAVSAALAFAHTHGIRHVHLTASNVLCEPRPPFVPRIVDFDNAVTTRDGDKTTLDVMGRTDLEGMIDVAAALLASPIACFPPGYTVLDTIGALRASTRSAEALRDRLEQLHAQMGGT